MVNKLSRNPRFVGQVFRQNFSDLLAEGFGRNPRFVGQVFRHVVRAVLLEVTGRNPRFVGQVFRPRGKLVPVFCSLL